MPQAIGIIATAVGTATASAVGYIVTSAVLTFAFASLSKRPGSGKLPINLTIRSTIAARQIVLGRRRVGGAILYANTSGLKGKYLWYVVAYAGHQCNDLQDCWLDNRRIADADINGTTGVVSTTSFDGKLKIWDHLGTGAQTSDTNLNTEFTEWTNDHKLAGICYRVFRLERSDTAFPTGAPQSFSSLLEGALTYSARLDSTNGGSGAHRRDDPRTWSFSRNWARNVRWFLSGGSVVNDQATRLIMYGLRAPDARIDDAYTIAAENVSDESLSGANAPPSGAQERYTLDMEFLCSDSKQSVMEDMLIAGGFGQVVYLHGQWRIYAGAYDAPVHTFTERDLHTDDDGNLPFIEIEDTTGDDERFNQASGVYVDEDRDHTEQITKVRSDAAYVTQDGGREIARELSLKAVTNEYRAQRIVELWLRKGRQMRRVTFRFGRQGLAVAPWETIDMSHDRYEWTNRVFRCLEREREITGNGGVLAVIKCAEESADVYTDLETADYTTGTSVTNALQADEVDAPTNLTVTATPGAIEFNWELGEFWEQNGISELWESDDDDFNNAAIAWHGRGTRAVLPKLDLTLRYYWVRIRTIANAVSDTEPATNGLPAAAMASLHIVPDREFALSEETTFWQNGFIVGQVAGDDPVITVTGGAVAGKAVLAINANVGAGSSILVSRPRPPVQAVPGSIYTVQLRWRRTASSGNALYAGVLRHQQNPSGGTFSFLGSDVILGKGRIRVNATEINAATVDEWQEISSLVLLPSDPAFLGGESSYVSAYVQYNKTGTVSVNVEVDFVQATIGVGCDPREITLTASQSLDDDHVLKKIIHNSGSAGTYDLPPASDQMKGAKIWFEQSNSGLMTIAASGGDTLKSPVNTTGNRALAGRYARAVAECDTPSSWLLTGDL